MLSQPSVLDRCEHRPHHPRGPRRDGSQRRRQTLTVPAHGIFSESPPLPSTRGFEGDALEANSVHICESAQLRRPPARHVVRRAIERLALLSPCSVAVRHREEEQAPGAQARCRRSKHADRVPNVFKRMERGDDVETAGFVAGERVERQRACFHARSSESHDGAFMMVDPHGAPATPAQRQEESSVATPEVGYIIRRPDPPSGDIEVPAIERVGTGCHQFRIEGRAAGSHRLEPLQLTPATSHEATRFGRLIRSPYGVADHHTPIELQLRPDVRVVDHPHGRSIWGLAQRASSGGGRDHGRPLPEGVRAMRPSIVSSARPGIIRTRTLPPMRLIITR